jgi:uncharacterized protein (TIGR02145 family)
MKPLPLFFIIPLMLSCSKDTTATRQLPEYGPCNGISKVTINEQTYTTIEIGDQCWLRENLNVGIMLNHSSTATDNNIIEKYCLNDLEENCTKYGAMYLWDEALAYNPDDSTGICPEGWHIASLAEWQELEQYISTSGMLNDSCCSVPKAIATTTGWKESECCGSPGCRQSCNGIAELNINAGGHLNMQSSTYFGEHIGTYFWTSDTAVQFEHSLIHIAHDYNSVYYGHARPKYALAIRCIKNAD